jgi:hypothetical protein
MREGKTSGEGSNSSIDYDGLGISRILWFGGSAVPASLPQKPLTGDEIEALLDG